MKQLAMIFLRYKMEFLKLKNLVLDNRSLAENDPMNLLKFEVAQKVFNEIGSTRYVSLVHRILDQNE